MQGKDKETYTGVSPNSSTSSAKPGENAAEWHQNRLPADTTAAHELLDPRAGLVTIKPRRGYRHRQDAE